MDEILTSKAFDKANKMLFYSGSALCLLLLVSAVVLFSLYVKQASTTVKNLEIQKVSPLQEKLDKKIWNFEILVPEGSASQAAGITSQLTAGGYQIQATGPASPDQKTIMLRVTPEMKEKAPSLLEDLSKMFKITTFTADLISNTANVQLIFGQE